MNVDNVTYTQLDLSTTDQTVIASNTSDPTYAWTSESGFVSTTELDTTSTDPLSLGQYETGYLSIDPDSNFLLSTGDFTLEAWWYLDDELFNPGTMFSQQFTTTSEQSFTLKYISSPEKFQLIFNNDTVKYEFLTPGIVAQTWYHVALVRYNGVLTMYVNGVPMSTTFNDTTDIQYSDEYIYIGAQNNGGVTEPVIEPWIGYAQDIRILTQAAYDGPFTPEPVTLAETTQARVHPQSNRNIQGRPLTLDSSTTTSTITAHTGSTHIRTYHVNVSNPAAADTTDFNFTSEIILYEAEADMELLLDRKDLTPGDNHRWSGALGPSDHALVRVTHSNSTTITAHITYW